MGILSFFTKNKTKVGSAQTAKERLQIIVAHEHPGSTVTPAYLPELQNEIIEVVKKYLTISDRDVKCELTDKVDSNMSVLEVNIAMPKS
ncbi:MAG: cell division topological specificity factor MinE [Psychromonas sp.]|nr:cell division topological specificity factor MinE [Psychromonas sp.]